MSTVSVSWTRFKVFSSFGINCCQAPFLFVANVLFRVSDLLFLTNHLASNCLFFICVPLIKRRCSIPMVLNDSLHLLRISNTGGGIAAQWNRGFPSSWEWEFASVVRLAQCCRCQAQQGVTTSPRAHHHHHRFPHEQHGLGPPWPGEPPFPWKQPCPVLAITTAVWTCPCQRVCRSVGMWGGLCVCVCCCRCIDWVCVCLQFLGLCLSAVAGLVSVSAVTGLVSVCSDWAGVCLQ